VCCGCGLAGLEDIKAMPYVRQTLAESLRMYPQPPLLIRRALAPDTLPPGLNGAPGGYPIGAGNHSSRCGLLSACDMRERKLAGHTYHKTQQPQHYTRAWLVVPAMLLGRTPHPCRRP
jgi:hypothetical protein